MQESFAAVVIRSAETWQFFAFVFAALIPLAFALIDELPGRLNRWRLPGKLGAFLMIGYFTLVSTWGRDRLVLALGWMKTETRVSGDSAPAWSQAMNDVVTPLSTLLLVAITAYYAWQSKQMVQEMRRQNRPYVYMTCEDNSLLLKNDGTRSAHHVQLEILSDAEVPGQIEWFAKVTIQRAGEPPAPRSPEASPEQLQRLMDRTERVSTLPKIRKPVSTIVPGAAVHVATVVGRSGERRMQELAYIIRYRDGAGTPYEERLTEEYRI